ncbi:MAG: phosphopeptide-binding protein [Bacteroidia bacterium]|nr:phosphopeptide-binding protein [Bacteroidia bacterium]
MKNLFAISLFAATLAFFSACEPKGKGHEGNGEDTAAVVVESQLSWEKDGLKVYAFEDSPQYPGAKISIAAPTDGAVLEPGTTTFNFNVEGYELGAQTADAATKGLSNSDKGQHIHLILNNAPYIAQYVNKFDQELEPGHYVALAFPSRSYHESVKNTYSLTQFTVGENIQAEPADLSAAHMFYSRPKGTYAGKDAQKLMLDFYLVNTDLAPDGNKVRATINGVEFMITKWVPYAIEGLPMGEVSIKLELLDKDGNLIPSPYNPVERKVTLVEEGMGMTTVCGQPAMAMK